MNTNEPDADRVEVYCARDAESADRWCVEVWTGGRCSGEYGIVDCATAMRIVRARLAPLLVSEPMSDGWCDVWNPSDDVSAHDAEGGAL